MTARAPLQLILDAPIGEAGARDDSLGFGAYAQALGEALVGAQGAFTVGVFGEWGSGKSSLMRLVERYIQDHYPDVVTVWFNAWRYEREEHPIIPLIATILRRLEQEKGLLERAGEAGTALAKALKALVYGFSIDAKAKLPGFGEAGLKLSNKDVMDYADKAEIKSVLDRSLYFDAYEALSKVKLPNDSKIVIIVDDLDRSMPARAIALLESVKLVLAQPGFAFVLGVSRPVIEGYLDHRYLKEYGIQGFEGRAYLDKIVQLPFFIPPHEGRMTDYTRSLLSQLSTRDQEAFADIVEIITSATGTNPRAAIRFVNNLLIAREVNCALAASREMELIPMGFFAVSQALRQSWEEVYKLLAFSDALCQAVSGWEASALRTIDARDQQDIQDVLNALLSSRDLRTILLESEYGRRWLRERALRDATISFLRAQVQTEQVLESGGARQVFLSYTGKDRDAVVQVAEILQDAGVNVFWDAAITPGALWVDELQKALTEARAIVYFIGESTPGSQYQEQELAASVARAAADPEFKLIPVLLPGADTQHLPEPLRVRQYLDLRSTPISRESLGRIIRALAY